MQYSHTQHGRLHWVIYLSVLAFLPLLWVLAGNPLGTVILTATLAILLLSAEAFRYLTVQDEGEHLAIRFGPIPLIHKRIPYAEITAVEPGRTNFLDGWGVHYVPMRGWTYNLWGFDCVVIQQSSRTTRIGTDDPEGLARFLRARIEAAP